MIKVAAFTGGKHVPAARFRVDQYRSPLLQQGISISQFPAYFGTYPPRSLILRPAWAAAALTERLVKSLASYRYDVTFLQREMLSTLLTVEPWTKAPRVLDVDDAIWAHKRGENMRRLISMSDLVFCGNAFILDSVSRWNKHCIVIPTAVDTARFCPREGPPILPRRLVVGWSGQSSNAKYVFEIQNALGKLLRRRKDLIFRVISDRRLHLPSIPADQYEFVQWSPENEVSTIQEMDVGLMPIHDDEWCRGKCSYKMLLYMSCGVPVVVSPYGMNAEVLARGICGFGAVKEGEWIDSVASLLSDRNLAATMGKAGRQIVQDTFSLQAVVPLIAIALKKLVSSTF